jgi:hypothetical protein
MGSLMVRAAVASLALTASCSSGGSSESGSSDPASGRSAVGDPIIDDENLLASVELTGRELVVAEGSRVVGSPDPNDCGFVVDLIITGDVDSVVDDYQAQFEQRTGEEATRTEDDQILHIVAAEAGGLHLVLGVQNQGDPIRATLSACYD